MNSLQVKPYLTLPKPCLNPATGSGKAIWHGPGGGSGQYCDSFPLWPRPQVAAKLQRLSFFISFHFCFLLHYGRDLS
jgi:hypothetical protein